MYLWAGRLAQRGKLHPAVGRPEPHEVVGDGVAGDFDGDGHQELLLAAGTVGSDKIAVGDVNGDGVDDIAAMTRIALGELGLFLLLSDP